MKVSTRISNMRKGHYARILTAAALLAAVPPTAWAQYNTVNKDFALRTGNTSLSLVARMRVTKDGLLGVGHTNPGYTRAIRFIGYGSGLKHPPDQTFISGTTTLFQSWPDAVVYSLSLNQ